MTSLTLDAEQRHEASLLQRDRFNNFLRITSICEALRDREKAMLRAQVHDLTELLAAFDLCEVQDAHLSAVRDRAFRRDIAPDRELLQVYLQERQLLQVALVDEMEDNATEQDTAYVDHGETNDSNSSFVTGERDVESLPVPLRLALLEKDVVILKLQNKLLLERFEYPASDIGADPTSQDANADRWASSSCRGEFDSQYQVDIERLGEQEESAIFEEKYEESARSIHELQQRIAELDSALAAESAKNAVLQQQNPHFQELGDILHELARQH